MHSWLDNRLMFAYKFGVCASGKKNARRLMVYTLLVLHYYPLYVPHVWEEADPLMKDC